MSRFLQWEKRPLRNPVIAHIHVPKCAGTSVRKLLGDHFGPAHAHLYVEDTFFVYSEPQLTACLSDPSVRAFSSHFVRTFPESLAGRDMLYLTFLRNPVEQFVSYLTYVRQVFHEIRDANLLSCLPSGLPSLTVRQATHWILSRQHHVNFRENYTTNFFARFPFHARYGNSKSESFYRERRLELAKRILNDFFFVGISEQMERSVASLQLLARQHQFDFPQGTVTIENSSHEGRSDLAWIHKDDEVGSLLLRSIREDQQLYTWALDRFNGRHESFAGIGRTIPQLPDCSRFTYSWRNASTGSILVARQAGK